MFKFLLISALIIFLMIRFSAFILKFALWLLGWQVKREMTKNQRSAGEFRKKEGTIEVMYAPDKKQDAQKKEFTGGDYIDYEEVK